MEGACQGMKIKLTYRRTEELETDIVLTCDATATVGAVATYLMASDPELTAQVPPDITLYLPEDGDRVLPIDAQVMDSGLKSGQVVSVIRSTSAVIADRPAAATLTVLAGLDKGRVFPLISGTNVVGRGPEAQVRLSDPLISRNHARLVVSDTVEIIDLGSANGVSVEGHLVSRQLLSASDRVEVGDSMFTVQLLAPGATAAPIESLDTGFIRSPRLVAPYEGRQFPVPEIPKKPNTMSFQVSMLIVPILMAGAMWFMTHQWMSVIFMAMMPLMAVGMYLDGLIGGRSAYRKDMKQWRTDMADLVSDATKEVSAEIDAREAENPSTPECVDAASRMTNLLWTRRTDAPGFAELRLGLGTLPARMTFDVPDSKQAPRKVYKQMMAMLEPFATIGPVPVVARLYAQGGLGVAGPRAEALPVVRALVAQAVCLHSPTELNLGVIASAQTGADWDWVKWLPHTSATGAIGARTLAATTTDAVGLLGEVEELLAARKQQQPDKPGDKDTIKTPAILLVVESDAPVEFGRLVDLTENGWRHGIYVIWTAPDLTHLPAACRVFADVSESDVGYLHDGELVTPVAMEFLSGNQADAWARRMAPLTDMATRPDDSSDVPRMTSYTAVVGKRVLTDPQEVIERWNENNSIVTGPFAPAHLSRRTSTLRAAIGVSVQGFHSLDLRTDGPHALVGGTTGSGKSELLQTWVLAMAVNHSPQRLNFLLVDYKGGSAFAECADLPHTVGLVTDLDAAGVHRALASLSAELRYREHLLDSRKAKDLVTMEKTDPDLAPPSLVIVVDEFAALVQEVPEFVDGVVNVAQRGRSLGLHLILATQRPAGVIKDNLRANTNLRIALRVADTDDSVDVLGVPMAAYFDSDIPGRAVSKTGPGRLITFQTAYVGGHTGEEEPPPDIQVETLGFGTPVVWEIPAAEAVPTLDQETSDLKRIVSTVQNAQTTAQLPLPRKPWLPDLARYYNLADPTQVAPTLTDAELIFGVADDPEHQSRPPMVFRPDVVGNMAIYGAGGSGKSTVLRTLAVVAGFSFRRGPCHVYGLDFSSRGLAMLADLPHVGSIISGSDEERVQRLLRWLRATIDERAARYSSVNAATITSYRTITGQTDEPRILLLVDGVAAFRQAYDSSLSYHFWDLFCSIAADGRPVGVHVVMTADQASGVPPALASTVQQRVLMRLASDDDYSYFSMPKGLLNEKSPAGRCLSGDLLGQVAILGSDPTREQAARMEAQGEWLAPVDAQSQAQNIRLLAQAMRGAGAGQAPPIRRLEEDIDLNCLQAEPGCFPLGVVSEDFSTLQVRASGPFIVAGPPGSGISTTLATIVKGLHALPDISEIHVFSDRTTDTGAGVADSVSVGAEAVAASAQELIGRLADESGPRMGLILEGLTDFTSTEAEMVLVDMVHTALRADHFVVCSGDPTTLSSAYSLLPLFKSGRRAMILQFDSDNPEIVQAVYPRARSIEFPPGRGMYADRGRARVVQVAR